ncbi:MAG: LytTR family transcriptional regulator [Clostridia bacterium]|nr:LytTR family transcriptional regulator [Clostridia bacterium]
MKQHEIAERSAELIIRYHENEYLPFLNAMDDDALWYGPAEGQFMRGRETMLSVWQAEDHPLRFTIGNLRVEHISAHPSFCNVMLTYSVVTHYPDGHDLSVYQRTLLCWCERREKDGNGVIQKIPRILVCHISNPHGKHEDDVIYLTNYNRVYAGNRALLRGERIHFHGLDRSDYFFLSDSVFWIEASSGGKHSVLHTASGDVEVLSSVSALEKLYPKYYLRCHQSYLINPHYLRNIRRFQVTLTDGTVLPVPEKKYTSFRDKALQALRQ